MPILWQQDAIQTKNSNHKSKSKMRYHAEITVNNDKKLLKCFETEQGKEDRSKFEIKEEAKKLKFIIEAEDSVALRATLNSITKLLTVYEKIDNMSEE
jgi:tRNA threonylcarbamoyladenosine modification (KEOPS) complex  Pcc1 subunit